MVSLPRSSRGKSHGKLTEVLGHQLRVGDAKIAATIAAAYKERGLTPPEHIEKPPSIRQAYPVSWEAYRDLLRNRVRPGGPNPPTHTQTHASNTANTTPETSTLHRPPPRTVPAGTGEPGPPLGFG